MQRDTWYRERAEDHGTSAAYYINKIDEPGVTDEPEVDAFNLEWNLKHAYEHAREAAHYALLVKLCPVHGLNCPGDSGGMFIDMNHPDDMYSTGAL